MELFVLAGGLGTRLREVVSDVPKSMAPVDGEPFLSYVLRYRKKQGVSAFLISVGYLAEKIQGYYGNSFEGCSIRYMEEISPLGTGGAFMKMLREVMPTNPFLMVNGDTFFAVDLLSLKKCHHQNGAILTICAFNSIETDRYACINQNAEGKIVDFGQKSHQGPSEIICNGGVYMFDASVRNYFKGFEEESYSLESDLIKPLISKSNSVFVKVFNAPFLDIGLPHDYERAAEILKAEKG
jgi:D-glycero-alpha-D-manno-heptose 1-phosphate guanylyltransferase